ncbi:MAG: hypothetical protein R6W82_05715 [bacterium]
MRSVSPIDVPIKEDPAVHFSTHREAGLTEKDLKMAKAAEEL